MIETNRLYLGRIYGSELFDSSYYRIDNKYRMFYFVSHKFYISKEDGFKEIESRKYYPTSFRVSNNYFVPVDGVIPIRDFFPTVNFPSKLTKKQLTSLIYLSNKMQCETYNKDESEQEKIELATAEEIMKRVLK